MKTLATIALATAALILTLSVGWVAVHGLTIHHDGNLGITWLPGICRE